MIDIERLDLPSASSFEIVVECPGQPNLLRSVQGRGDFQKEEPDEVAQIGIRIHTARETSVTLELDEEELRIYKAGRGYEDALVACWIADRQLSQWGERQREDRMWLHDPTTGKPCLSAKLDAHYIGDDSALIADWKTGWSWKLTPSQRNWQLRVQAVLTAREYNGIKHVRVSFVKPIAKYDRLDFTDYNEDDLQKAEALIYHHLWLAKQPDAPRRAGEHCNYCPVKAYCKEAAAYSMLPSIINRGSEVVPAPSELSKENLVALVQQMPIQDVALVHLRAGMVTKILEACKARLKTLDDATLSSLGLIRSEGRRLDPIVDTKGLYDFLIKFGISEAEIWSAMKFSKGELVDALRRDQGWAKAAADGFVKGELKPFIEEKKAEASIGAK